MIWRRSPCNETVIPLFYAFWPVFMHTRTFLFFFSPLRIKIRVYSSQRAAKKSNNSRILCALFGRIFRSHPWHLMEVKCLLTHFLFFFALLFVLMDCMRVNRWLACMYVPVFLFEIGNQGIFFHHFGIRFKVLLLLAACCSLFLLQFIIIIVVINLQCVFIRIFYSFSCIFSFVSLLSLSLLFYYHPLFFLSSFFLCLHNF